MEIRISGFLIFLSCLLSLVSAKDSESLNNSPKIIDFGFKGQKITVKTGEEIQIELDAIGGTGYSWYLDGLDQTFFEILTEGTRSPEKEAGSKAGGPVTMFWRLKALKPGTTGIKLNYYRIWEGKGTAAKHFQIGIQIVP